MDAEPRLSRPGPDWRLLAALALLVVLRAALTYGEPPERDLAAYAVIAEGLLDGRALYTDLWDHKPPGVHLAYAAAQLVTGPGPASLCLAWLAATLATLVGVYVATLLLSHDRVAAGLAAAFWVAVCGHLVFEANQPNVEAFINACLIWVLVALALDAPDARRWRWAAAAGLLLGVAAVFKPVALTALLLLVPHVLLRGGQARRPSRRDLAEAGLVVGLALAVPTLPAVYFAAVGRLDDYTDAIVAYNRFYAGSVLENLWRGRAPDHLLSRSLTHVLPLFAASGLLLLRARRPVTRVEGFAAAWAIATWIAVAAPGHYHPHYYQLWLPLLAVAASLGLRHLGEGEWRSWRVRLCAAAALVALIGVQARHSTLTPDEWSVQKYGRVFLEARQAARDAVALLRGDEVLYAHGDSAAVYYHSGRRPPTGVIYSMPLIQGPLRGRLARRVRRDLEAKPPVLMVVSGGLPVDRVLGAWLRERYALLPSTDVGPRRYRLYALRGGRLDPDPQAEPPDRRTR
ncbi:MAG: hypothetical protein NDJ94_11250 [Vicinamibacteria bacterium]|nr:hypothetical protein [Vicinamibacteria bacterium]